MLVIRGTITFTKECISHYKIYREQKGPDIFILQAKGSLIFYKNKNGVFTFTLLP
jgi:hypothetical protein